MKPLLQCLKLLAKLPDKFLFFLSDCLFFFLCYIIRYRKKVIEQNLKRAFPNLPPHIYRRLKKRFYRYFSDFLIENLFLFRNNPNFIFEYYGLDVDTYKQLYERYGSVILCLGHQFNWEWGSWALPLQTDYKVFAFYLPLKNKKVDAIVNQLRAKQGTIPVPADRFLSYVRQMRQQKSLCVMIADQHPANLESAHWVDFFGYKTPFLSGMEKLARALNIPVAFARIERLGRGHYRIHTRLLVENPRAVPQGAITQAFASALEDAIKQQPPNWLWSHRRWKHAK